jgi:hypothetical protein
MVARILVLVVGTALGSQLGSILGVGAVDAAMAAIDDRHEPGLDKQRIYTAVHYGHPMGTVAGGLCGAILALAAAKWVAASRPSTQQSDASPA